MVGEEWEGGVSNLPWNVVVEIFRSGAFLSPLELGHLHGIDSTLTKMKCHSTLKWRTTPSGLYLQLHDWWSMTYVPYISHQTEWSWSCLLLCQHLASCCGFLWSCQGSLPICISYTRPLTSKTATSSLQTRINLFDISGSPKDRLCPCPHVY